MINNTNEFIIYALQVNIIWAIALLFYYFLLRKETFFSLNRFYLLITVLTGLVIPYVGTYIQSLFENEAPIFTATVINAIEVEAFSTQISSSSFSFTSFLILIFWIGFGIQFIKMILGFIEINKLKNSSTEKSGNITFSAQRHQPFSFFNKVFISNDFEYSTKEIHVIIEHEQKHIKLGHSWDILAFELLKIFFWYSPIIYYFQKQLKLIHEFQVDAMVLRNVDKLTYGQVLVNQVYLNKQFNIANHFIFSQLKTRIDMMTKSKSSKKAIFKYIMAIPIFTAFLFIFNLDNVIAKTYDSFMIEESFVEMNNYTSDTEDPVFKTVDEMPRFKGCEDDPNMESREKCAMNEMLKYIYSNIKYPSLAKEKDIQGTTVIQFVVEKNGQISSTKIVREIGGGCGEEARSVVADMPQWIPGKHEGKDVRVEFNLPIKFKLQGDSDSVVSKAEKMPRFPGCEDEGTDDMKDLCAKKKMLNYIYSNIKYPKAALDAKTQGVVVIGFIVEKDGRLSKFKIERDLENNCGEEALRVVKSMPKWIPGEKDGKIVPVAYKLPIKYKLQGPKPPAPPAPPTPPTPRR